MKTLQVLLFNCAALVAGVSALAQNYSLEWSAIGVTAASIASGSYSVSASVGQVGTGEPAAAGAYSLAGGFWAVLTATASTNTAVQGTLRFTNANPAILQLLNAPGNEGLQSYFITAVSQPPAPAVTATTTETPAVARTSTPYSITVNPSAGGTAYAVTPRVALLGGAESYYFSPRTSALVQTGGPPVTLDFAECLCAVTVRFVDTLGQPAAVDGGQIVIAGSATKLSSIATGASQTRIYLRGGATHPLTITVNRGTDFYRDRLTWSFTTNVAAVCDALMTIDMLVPEVGALGRIQGQVDMLGEFELAVDGSDAANLPDSTGVIAFNGPFQNQRWAALGGALFSVPSSGGYLLSNVAPSSLSAASPGYTVYSQMYFRTNRQIESFRSPALGFGSNAPLPVAASQTVNLSNLFVIQPGYLRGQVLLQGPPERAGQESQLRGLNHASDNDVNGDGVPDQLGAFGLYWCSVGAEGVNRRAAGAAFTAAYGFSTTDFDGSFLPASGAFAGTYELVLGGLLSEPSLWSPKHLNLTMSSPTGLAATNYYSASLAIADRRNPEVAIVAGSSASRDVAYCLSEVRLVLRNPNGTFYNPEVRTSTGTFAGQDFQGQSADYGVTVKVASGFPNRAADAASRGEVVMYLPQGTYHLLPSIMLTGSGSGRTGLEPVDFTVGCQQRLALDGCLRLEVPVVSFAEEGPADVPVLVVGCSNEVSQITYRLNGGPWMTACAGCGVQPALNLSLNLANGQNTLVVKSKDILGNESALETPLWAGLAHPRLRITFEASPAGNGAIRIAWPAQATGFRLQRSLEASAGSWFTITDGLQTDGAENFLVIPAPPGRQFYRLIKP